MRVLCVFGTRPEAIKMAPVIHALRATPGLTARVCVTGQHAELLAQVTGLFGIRPDHDLALMRAGQTLTHVTTAVLDGMAGVLAADRPDCVLVHGDTTTSMAAALAAFYAGIPVGHVEAGLRTRDLASPFPEEANRQITGRLSRWHFAPTTRARQNLMDETVPEDRISVTGNTVIDALGHIRRRVLDDPARAAGLARQFNWLEPGRRLILVTLHRRENQSGGLDRISAGLARLARRGDVQIVWPVHPSPAVQAVAERHLARLPAVHLVEPLGYLPFLWLMAQAHFIVTDAGGIQEEAPSFGRPVLVARETTERPEAVEAGTVRLVGTDGDRLVAEGTRLLDDPATHAAMSGARNPYGDGRAAERIAATLAAEAA